MAKTAKKFEDSLEESLKDPQEAAAYLNIILMIMNQIAKNFFNGSS